MKNLLAPLFAVASGGLFGAMRPAPGFAVIARVALGSARSHRLILSAEAPRASSLTAKGVFERGPAGVMGAHGPRIISEI